MNHEHEIPPMTEMEVIYDELRQKDIIRGEEALREIYEFSGHRPKSTLDSIGIRSRAESCLLAEGRNQGPR